MSNVLHTRITLRNDTMANWMANEEAILLRGEIGIAFDKDGKTKLKIGDGNRKWGELEWFGADNSFMLANLHYKGRAESPDSLPLEGNELGDAYRMPDGKLYGWNGEEWNEIRDPASEDIVTTDKLQNDDDTELVLFGGGAE